MTDRAPWEPVPPEPSGGDSFARPYATGHGSGYAQTALNQEIQRVMSAVEGTRNDTLNRAAFSLGQLVAAGELDRDQVERELTAAAELVGLQPREIQRTIASGLSGGHAKPRTTPIPSTNHTTAQSGTAVEPVPDSSGQPDPTEWVLQNLPALDWHALWADDTPEEWIIEPLVPARRLVALYSAPKVGKSLLMLEIAVNIANGTKVLGVTPDRPRKVLYVDFENDPRGDIRTRLEDMGYGPDQLDRLVYLSFPQLSALDSPTGGAQLMAAVSTYECEVVVIDTVSRAIAGEENENDTWLAFYRHTGRALKAAGVALVRLDHAGKDETRGQRGGSAKSGDVDAVWRMSKIKDDLFRLECEAHRMPLVEKMLIIHRETEPHLHHRVDAAGAVGAWSAQVQAIAELLDELGLPRDIGGERARQAVRQNGIKAANKVISEAVKLRKGSMNISVDLSGTGAS